MKLTNDKQRLDWLAKNPGLVTFSRGYHGSKHAWVYNIGGNYTPAKSLRDAINRAAKGN